MHQTPETLKKDRRDHIWIKKDELHKCVTCGAITDSPPDFPTPDDWNPQDYVELNDDERILSGFVPSPQ